MKFDRADSRVRTRSFPNFSGTPSRVGHPASVLVLPNHQEALNMGKELVPETSGKTLHPDAAVGQRKFH